MKNRIGRLITCTVAAVFFMAGSSYAFEATGSVSKKTASDSSSLGAIGTKEDPISSVDGTGVEFADWAKGKYFTTDCKFLNITKKNNVELRLTPVYEPTVKTLTVSAGGGKFGTEASVQKEVNFNDKTIDVDKEKTEIDTSKDLGAVLSSLTPDFEGFYPYFYMLESSTFNKRIFIDKNDAAKTKTDDADLETAVYDLSSDGTAILVWKDCADATDWNDGQKKAVKFIAAETGLTKSEYHTYFGGDTEVPYGEVTVEKKLPGASVTSYAWELKKDSVKLDGQTAAAYTKSGMGSSYDNARLTETISYGTGSAYTLETKELELTAYQRPAVSGETIK